MKYYTRLRKTDGELQEVRLHLLNVARLCEEKTIKIGMPKLGKLLGLLHDIGKNTEAFRKYFLSAIEFLKKNDPDYVDYISLKGQIDHSTAGAVYAFQNLLSLSVKYNDDFYLLLAVIIASIICGHHGNLNDIFSISEGKIYSPLLKRLNKDDIEINLNESINNLDEDIKSEIDNILYGKEIYEELKNTLSVINSYCKDPVKSLLQVSLLIKFLHSCLIDADRQDAANFEDKRRQDILTEQADISFEHIYNNFDNQLKLLNNDSRINKIRSEIANDCLNNLKNSTVIKEGKGILKLAIPTGGGKTFLSNKIAFLLAKQNKKDKVFNFAPFISIIEQNAEAIRSKVEIEENDKGKIVLEHHSNLIFEKDDDEKFIHNFLTESWNTKIVFSSAIQFFDCVYSRQSQSNRRFNSLANSVIIFDEVQTIPLKVYFLFNALINFLTKVCNSIVILCTATQPLLDKLDKLNTNKDKSICESLEIPAENNLVNDLNKLFFQLKRTNINYCYKIGGYDLIKIAELVLAKQKENGNILVIVNTTLQARELYESISKIDKNNEIKLYHLSTKMCPQHRKDIINTIKDTLPIIRNMICISTQLIEAGVDISFDCVFRYRAGIDSIIQAAGRCNRNGDKSECGQVFVINIKDEDSYLNGLDDIKRGINSTENTIGYFNLINEKNIDILDPRVIEKYYRKYCYESIERQSDLFCYPINDNDNIYYLLSNNRQMTKNYSQQEYFKALHKKIPIFSAFRTAANNFKLIEEQGISVIVPYGKGKILISQLSKFEDNKEIQKILIQAQLYSIQIRGNQEDLESQGIITKTKLDIYYLNEAYYNEFTGFSKTADVNKYNQ